MNRLTNHFDYCYFIGCGWLEENVCRVFGTDTEKCHRKSVYEKLCKYEDLEEQGLLLRLPCKVGQTVYAFAYPRTDIAVVVEEEVEKFLVWENGVSIETDGGYYPLDEIGVYVFLTKEEAEQALDKMKEV